MILPDLLPPAPTGAEFKAARIAAGLSQPEAAKLLACASLRTVQAWESGQNPVDVARWAVFLLWAGNHVRYTLKRRKHP